MTFTAPVSYWYVACNLSAVLLTLQRAISLILATVRYLRGFDLEHMMTYVDWVNVMSYDLHGTWDHEDASSISGQVLARTNLTEIDDALGLVRCSPYMTASSYNQTAADPKHTLVLAQQC